MSEAARHLDVQLVDLRKAFAMTATCAVRRHPVRRAAKLLSEIDRLTGR